MVVSGVIGRPPQRRGGRVREPLGGDGGRWREGDRGLLRGLAGVLRMGVWRGSGATGGVW